MKIIEIDIDKLIPYERNNKIHDVTQINHIANSIKEFGFTQPIVVDKKNTIIVGHGRYEGAKILGLEKVPCIIAEDLTDEQIKKYRILDNKLNESDWNLMNLKIELDGLDNFNFGDIILSKEELFPEMGTPSFDSNDEEDMFSEKDEDKKENELLKLIVEFDDIDKANIAKKELIELGYKNLSIKL